jgi:hypothetical protein
MGTPDENSERDKFTLAIKCHWCGHTGLSLWEKTAMGRERMSLDGFYERIAKKQPYKTETVCNNCNRPQPV